MIDFSKPLQTRDGRSVRILLTDRKSDGYPILALIETDGEEEIESYTSDGRYYRSGEENFLDLVNVPDQTEVKFKIWLLRNIETGRVEARTLDPGTGIPGGYRSLGSQEYTHSLNSKPRTTLWVNLDSDGSHGTFSTKGAADANAYSDRIARVRVEVTEGRFDD